MGEESEGMWEAGLTAHLAVNLFVTAIAAGEVAEDTAPKVQERLSHIVSKVPKEQKTCVEVPPSHTPHAPTPPSSMSPRPSCLSSCWYLQAVYSCRLHL
jgi:hypothetical protein